MSELKWYWAFDPYLDPPEKQKESALKAGYVKVVNKSDADKVIAELEEKLAAAQQAQRFNEPEALYSNLDTISRLSHEKDVIARRERKQNCAMWLARAERAKAIKWHEGLERYLQERKKYWPSRFSFMKDDEMYHVWYKCWCEVERKCRAKAEKYK